MSGPGVSIESNALFERQLTTYSAVITDGEKKEIQAKWAEMTSESDCDSITTELKSLANKYHKQLPEKRFHFP